MAEPKYENEFIKYVFTEPEKKDIAAEMAQKIVNLQQAEDDKKAIMSDYKSQIDGIQAGINSACQVVPNYAKKVWEYIRIDTGLLIKEKDMTSNDLQMEFEN